MAGNERKQRPRPYSEAAVTVGAVLLGLAVFAGLMAFWAVAAERLGHLMAASRKSR